MRAINRYLFIVVVALFSCDTGSNVEPVFEQYFIKYYGKNGDQRGIDIVVNDDGSMVLLGNSTFSSITTPFVIKVDPKGNVLWQRQCGGSTEGINETGVDIELIKKGPHQGKLIIASNIGEESNSRIRLLRIDQDGHGIDSIQLDVHPGGVKQIVKSVTPLETRDGYAVTGYTDGALTDDEAPVTPETDAIDIFAYRIDENFQTLTPILKQGGETQGSGIKVFEKINNNELQYLVFSYSDWQQQQPGYSGLNFEIRINSEEATQLGIRPAGNSQESQSLFSALKTPLSVAEGYLMVGSSKDAAGSSSIFVAKFSQTLQFKTFEHKVTLPESSHVECVAAGIEESRGYYLLANDLEHGNIILVQIDLDGSWKWTKIFGSTEGNDSASGMAVLPDGRVAIVGTMGIESNQRIALMVVNRQGNLSN